MASRANSARRALPGMRFAIISAARATSARTIPTVQIDSQIQAVSAAAPATSGFVSRLGHKLFGDDGLSFKDVLDLVNPLQHIPVVGDLYRKLTGDTIDPAIRVAGGALFGGPLGAALSVAGMVIEDAGDTPSSAATAPTAVADTAEPRRGGWLLNADGPGLLPPLVPAVATTTQIGENPALASGTAALADAESVRPRGGGWILNAAKTGRLSPSVPVTGASATKKQQAAGSDLPLAASARPETRRGGWMLIEAYVLTDLAAAARPSLTTKIEEAV